MIKIVIHDEEDWLTLKLILEDLLEGSDGS